MEGAMHRVFYTIEDYLEDRSLSGRAPWWLRRIMRSMARTVAEAGDLVAFH
jgi:hypothetical protein